MYNQFYTIYELDSKWYIAYCPEIPEANGMGRTKEECRENLIEAIQLILQDANCDLINLVKKIRK